MNTKDLQNKKVWTSRPTKRDPDAVKKVGRIHAFVFHPNSAKLAGFLIKRPDVALMFHREDMFVAYDGFMFFDNDIVVREEPEFTGRGALKRLGVDLDSCVIWFGLPVMLADGTSLGYADAVDYDLDTGKVISLEVSGGATANTLLGKRCIPGSQVRGFKRGMGTKLYISDEDDDPDSLGALIVDDSAVDADVEGGVAEKAGAATAIATDKAKTTYKKVVKKAKPAADEAAKVASKAAKSAGEAVQKGAYVTGRQLGRAEGMFGRFKDEFKKALNDDK